jgi:hypothetical protein
MTISAPSSSFLDQYLTRKQLGEFLGTRLRGNGKAYSEYTVKGWEKGVPFQGPPTTKFGDTTVYFLPSVEKWLREREGVAA